MSIRQRERHESEETSIYISFQQLATDSNAFHHPVTPPPPPYTDHSDDRTPLLLRAAENEVEDEESQYGFWGENTEEHKDIAYSLIHDPFEENGGCCCGLYELISVLCYVFLVLLLALNLDFFLTRVGLASGTTIMWNVYGLKDPTSVSLKDYKEMNFCLATPNREVPGPRIWHFMPDDSIDDCTTRIMTLMAGVTDQWKLSPGDDIIFEDTREEKKRSKREDKFISNNRWRRS